MTKIEALTLAHSIELDHGTDSARAVQLGPNEWIVQLMGPTSGWGHTRATIYVCWDIHDWDHAPSDVKSKVQGEDYGRKTHLRD